MNFLFLDLEMNQPSNKIIQVGWTIADPISGYAYKVGGEYVNPFEPLTPIISNLCGIEQNVLDKSDALDDVYMRMYSDYLQFNCSPTVVTWSKGDLALLRSQVNETLPWPFGMHYIDAKNLYQSWKLKTGADHLKGGLARAMTKFNLKFEGRKHNAEDDAYNTFRIYKRLLMEFK
jgi:inhibitor of KinA sporulation pathway (predicted exonuclease)